MRRLDKKIIIPIITVLLFMVYVSYITMQSPLVAIGVKNENNQWIVNEVHDNGWGFNQDIDLGYILLEVNGESPDKNKQIIKEQVIRTASSFTFLDKNGEEKNFSVSFKSEKKQLFSHLFFPIAYTLLTVYVAIYIYRKQKEEPSALTLIQFLLCIAVAYGSAAASSRGDIVGRIVNGITFGGCLIFYIQFLNVFLKRFNITFIKPKNLRVLYSLPVIIFVANIITLVVSEWKSYRSLMELGIFSFLLILIIILLTKNYSKYKNKPGNQAVKLLVFIFILAFSPFALLYAIPVVLFSRYIINAEIAVMFLVLIPISFIYLQLAEKLFDIDYILDRFKYYIVLTFPFSSIVCGIIVLFLGENIASVEIMMLFIVLFAGSIIFLYVKEWLDYKNRKYMFSTRGDLQKNMYTFFHKTKDENKVQVVVDRILKEMENTLDVQSATFVEIQQQQTTKDWQVHYTSPETSMNLTELEEVEWEYESVGKIFSFSKGFAVVIGSDIGVKKVILCDEKKSGTKLNIDEKTWIEMMAYFASVVVENMKLIEGLVEQIDALKLQETNENPMWLSRLLFALSEKERASLSNDLHDSILQEQLQLLREMDSIRKMVDDQALTDKLNGMKEQMLDNVHLIRETCMELRPPLLNEQGLKESLHQLIRQTKLRCNFLLHVSIGETIHLNKEKELIFYRVVQELLNNAMKHSKAKEVRIDLHQVDQSITLVYEDDGIGFDLKNEGDSFSSMGLVGIKERIRSINGSLEIISSKDQGMKVRIEVGMEGDLK
ncbi:sensor histidine kinase [Psychrobacillus soli]|uniref:Sensor histidine kinase n=1 Tax=Psychrobacillus soli TaxID=1543965 RepID=A0A544TFZ4_9BACI|nr:sensor histidine kinase [Psychrobacillus soli]TQR16316.1 sensor histidine kinase [Psychrobacillus soli]